MSGGTLTVRSRDSGRNAPGDSSLSVILCAGLVLPPGRKRPHAYWLLALSCLFVFTLPGCDRLSRHKVLTFFFTGVPSLEEQDKMKAERLEGTQKPKPDDTTQVAAARAPSRSTALGSSRFSHGPYAANTCYECHEVSASGGLRGFGKKEEAAGSVAQAGVVPGKMVAPMAELCVGCHDSKSPAKAFEAGLWVHGPVGNGYCILCHGPHNGPEPYLLLKQADALCADCHTPEMIHAQDMHRNRSDCTSCHNAHVGRDRRLLKAEHQELW